MGISPSDAVQVYSALANLGQMLENANDKTGACDALGIKLNEMETIDSVKDLVSFEVLRLWLHLSASDGTIDDSEVGLINTIFQLNGTAEDVRDLIIDTDIYTTDFSESLPLSFVIAIYSEEWFSKYANAEIKLADIVLEGWLQLGAVLLEIDGDICAREKSDFVELMANIENGISVTRRSIRSRI